MLHIYTDGSSIGNPGQGGWAFLVLNKKTGEIEHKAAGGESYTTNNRMELTAVIQTLIYAQEKGLENEKIVIHMDSMYVHDGIEKYLAQWVRRGWKLANKRPVQNKDLWILLNGLLPKFSKLELQWVKAHATSKYNNIVDELARKKALSMPISHDKILSYEVEEENPKQKSLF